MPMILGVLAMQLGARTSDESMRMMRVLRPCLRHIFNQLQIVTALDENKNDSTRWVLCSRCLDDTL